MTYDPAFQNTASCRSRITFIDGDKGILEYRGYPIDQLAANCTFLDTAYLLLFGELPTPQQSVEWTPGHHDAPAAAHQRESHPRRVLSRRPRHGRVPLDGRCALDGLPRRQARPGSGVAREADSPADCKGAKHRRARLPARAGPALRRARGRAQLHGQLHPHALQEGRRTVPAAAGARAGARSPVHPARRSRAELQHACDARHRQLAGRSILGAGGRGRGALRPAPWRRQRSGAADARRNRLREERAGVHHRREARRRTPPDGLRSPRLQVCTTRVPASSSRQPTRSSR